mgnify:CR=1 FL=1
MRNKRILSFLVALVSLLTLLPAASAANDVYVGQTFYFGNYEQDGNLSRFSGACTALITAAGQSAR